MLSVICICIPIGSKLLCNHFNWLNFNYIFSRNNKSLDLSLTIRFANVPNNCQLELKVSKTQRKEEKVTLAVDLENGDRKVEEFDSKQSLWDIIQHLFKENPVLLENKDNNICLIYMRKEIEGEIDLKETNLRKLGLINGKVSMRLIFRAKDAPKQQAFVESINLKRHSEPKEESLVKKPTVQSFADKSIDNSNANDSQQEPETQVWDQTQAQSVQNEDINDSLVKPSTSHQTSGENESQCEDMDTSEDFDQSDDTLFDLGGNNSEILFRMSDKPNVANRNIPDSFFEVTKDDLVYLLRDLQKQQVGKNESLLETKEMRERKEKEKIGKYKSTIIRIVFPFDKLILQAIFKPNDSLENVIKTIRPFIIDESIDFYLYTSPPKQRLKPEMTLFELKLVPAAVVHFGSELSQSGKCVIKEEFKHKISSYRAALKLALNVRKVANDSIPGQSTQSISNLNIPLVREQTPVNQNQQKDKIPKWFKTNK